MTVITDASAYHLTFYQLFSFSKVSLAIDEISRSFLGVFGCFCFLLGVFSRDWVLLGPCLRNFGDASRLVHTKRKKQAREPLVDRDSPRTWPYKMNFCVKLGYLRELGVLSILNSSILWFSSHSSRHYFWSRGICGICLFFLGNRPRIIPQIPPACRFFFFFYKALQEPRGKTTQEL